MKGNNDTTNGMKYCNTLSPSQIVPYNQNGANNYETLGKEGPKTDGQLSKKGHIVYEELRLKFNQPNGAYNKLGATYADMGSKTNASQQ